MTCSVCPTGYVDIGGVCVKDPSIPKPEKNPGPANCVGNPVNSGTGNKYQPETDFAGIGPYLSLTRHYNSQAGQGGAFGSNWSAFASLKVNSASSVSVTRPDQKTFGYSLVGAVWTPDADVPHKLVQTASGWQLTTSGNVVENYDTAGRLTSIVNADGSTQTFAYDAAGLLTTVTDPFGRSLGFAYASNRVSTITTPAGVIAYAYDSLGNLATVTYPDLRSRTYHYNEPEHTSGASLPHALTGITDENGDRYATYQYAADGKAISTAHAGGADQYNLAYNPDGSTTVTDPLGTARTHTFTTVLGVVKSTGQTQPGGSGCGAASSAVTYDANGNVASRTDFNGHKTCYAHDLTRNLETARVEGIAAGAACPTDVASYTPAANTAERKILTQWHSTYRLPVSITESGRHTTTVYDDHGNITSRSVTDTVTGQTRTSTTAYTYHPSVPGVLVQRIDDGPRLDVADITTTDYYPPDATCAGGHLGCRGEVSRITNALGHATEITRYTAHGQPEEIVDANGLVTTLAYDPRQRLTQRSVGNELTQYAYDFAGQLKQITLPSGAVVRYDYDAAHRLTDIWDQHNNRIHYTLDAMGNRIQEDTFDAAGTAVAIRNRSFDALNRLWQDIGAVNAATGNRPTTTYAYDAGGNLTSVTPPGQPATSYQYDALNRLFASTDALGGTSQYRYDPLGQLTEVHDPRNVTTTYEVNAFGEQTRVTSPDSGVTVKTYDAAGNLVASVDARGKQSTYSYDAINRLTGISFTSGNPVSFSYDQGAGGIGRLTGMTDESGTTTWQYDPHGRVTQKTLLVGGVPRSIAYRYDFQGRLDQLTYPSGKLLTLTWNADKPQALTLDAQPVVSGIQYHPFGGPRQWTLGNAQVVTRVYDADNRLAAYTLGDSVRGLVFDDAGRIVRIDDSNPAYTQHLGYDTLDRVTGWNTALLSQAYTYDAGGNRTSAVFGGSASYSHSVAADSNRLQSVEGPVARTYQHDPAGNIVDDSRTSFAYNDRGRMAAATTSEGTTSYLVNGLGQRSVKTGSEGIRFVYDEAGRLIGEYDAGGTLLQETLYLGDIPVAVVR